MEPAWSKILRNAGLVALGFWILLFLFAMLVRGEHVPVRVVALLTLSAAVTVTLVMFGAVWLATVWSLRSETKDLKHGEDDSTSRDEH